MLMPGRVNDSEREGYAYVDLVSIDGHLNDSRRIRERFGWANAKRYNIIGQAENKWDLAD